MQAVPREGKLCDRRQGRKKNTQATSSLVLFEPWLVEKGFNLIGYNISYTEKRANRQKCSPHNRNITNKEEIWGWFSQTSMLVVSGWSHSLPEAAGRQVSWKLQSIVRPTIDVFNLEIKYTLISLSFISLQNSNITKLSDVLTSISTFWWWPLVASSSSSSKPCNFKVQNKNL